MPPLHSLGTVGQSAINHKKIKSIISSMHKDHFGELTGILPEKLGRDLLHT